MEKYNFFDPILLYKPEFLCVYNIFLLPLKFFYEWAFSDLWRGYFYILVNGDYYFYKDIPKSYLLTNIIYKSPEYFLVSYLLFFGILIGSKSFFVEKFRLFYYKLFWELLPFYLVLVF